MQSLPRPLAHLLSSQLLPSSSSASPATLLRRPSAAITGAVSQRFSFSPALVTQSRHASTSSAEQRRQELQQRQSRLADKLGRMKQNLGQMMSVPVFANHIPPREGRKFAPNTPFAVKRRYWLQDAMNTVQSLDTRRRFRKVLGSGWLAHFQDRSLIAYKTANQVLATGNYDLLLPLASQAVLDNIKAMRVRSFPGNLGLSWKLHAVVSQEIVCARQMELSKPGEFYGQCAVRFVTKQSLEIRDSLGKLVGNGSHDSPQEVTEYCVLQREMWHPNDDWKIVKKGARETDLIANPADQA